MRPRLLAQILYLAVLWTLILLPLELTAPPPVSRVLGEQLLRLEREPGTLALELVKSGTHAVLFLPLAPLFLWGRERPLRRGFAAMLVGLALALGVSTETLQLFVDRGTSIPDFVMDLLGFFTGWAAAEAVLRWPRCRAAWRLATSPAALGIAAAGVLAATYWLLVPSDVVPFHARALETWDAAFPIVLGNERGRSKPWLGVIEEAVVRDGDGREVFAWAPRSQTIELAPDGRVRRVRGSSGGDLVAPEGSDIWPAPGGGVEFRAPSVLRARDGLAGGFERLRQEGAFSLDVRFRAASVDGYEQRRIITSSIHSRARNFTVTQIGDGLEVRLRTAVTGKDGSPGGVLRVKRCLVAGTTVTAHVAYSGGVLEFSLDGKHRRRHRMQRLDPFTWLAFGAAPTLRVRTGLAFVAWAGVAACLWGLLGRRGRSPGRAWRWAAPLAALLLVLTVLAAQAQVALAEDWPAWRGPSGEGHSTETRMPTRWQVGERPEGVLWTWEDPGLGHSSPIIRGDALYLTTGAGESRLLLRLSAATGKEVWRREVLRCALERKHTKNSHASSTPATDGERVYVSFLDGVRAVAAAFDQDGKEVWRVSPGEFHSVHGFCSSPLLFQDLVILNCDQDALAYIVAFDRATGTERWRTDRANRVRSYCPPRVFTVDGRPQMVLAGSKTVSSYDPSSGKRLWVCDGPTEQCVASAVYGDGLVFITGGYPDREILAIDPRGTGDVTASHIRWRARRGVSYVPSPLHLGGHFYIVDDGGVLSAIEARTGEYRAQRRLGGNFSASLVHAAGHIYAASEDGVVHVLRATPELEPVARIDMGDPIYATPAPSSGRLFIRTWKRLYAIGGSDGSGAGQAAKEAGR